MKKIMLIIVVLFSFINLVSAKENKLIISSSDNKLYYDSALFDSNIFMNYVNMKPGDMYEDKLIIDNQTEYNFKLYLKIKNKNDNELVNYLTMKLYLDNNLIYNGDVIGADSITSNDILYLGNFAPGQTSLLDSYVNFSLNYNNIFNNDSLIVDWSFYAETDENINEIIQIVPSPKTGINISKFIIIISTGLLLIGLIIIIFLFFKKNKDDKHENK